MILHHFLAPTLNKQANFGIRPQINQYSVFNCEDPVSATAGTLQKVGNRFLKL